MKKYALLCAVVAMTAGSAVAKDWDEIRMASEGAYPPFNVTAADGSMRGFDIDIGNALCEEMKAKCSWVKQDWDGMIPALVSRKFDAIIASMSITDERKAKVDFTNKYYASPLALIAKKGSPLRPDLASLKGKKIGVQRGTVADNFATKFWEGKGPEIIRYAKQDEAYLDLNSGRMDAAFADFLEAYGGFLTKPEGAGYDVAGERVFGNTAEEKGVVGEGIGIAVRKKDKDLTEKLNKALVAIRASGKYEEIRKKYFPMDIYGN
ncbi:ABC transporter substrate-binding protein [Azoarcus sp. KH32C]|uniref:ABC transporter substrate-binding protein n=1 Tax=Azoarcus sp. KH32C TaxID=748247 RepID=UPI0002386D7F|nr:ABC transporter substrate-binding protein [Azoarcus sp. KH32C]BAL23884.1 extracellular solute-binding protein family 3, lysine/arginine/ornithine transport system substrate-binding protein [Azoarcus sp. KH32C]